VQRNPDKWLIKKIYSRKFGPMWILYPPDDGSDTNNSVATSPTFEEAMAWRFNHAYRRYMRRRGHVFPDEFQCCTNNQH
jgi:hypothetical protein